MRTIIQGAYCGLSTASDVFLIFTTYYCKGYEKKGVLLHEYSKYTILHTPLFRRVVNVVFAVG